MWRSAVLFPALLLLALDAVAHEVVVDARVAPQVADVSGVVRTITVDDDTRAATQRTYRLLTTSDGDSLLVGGDAAATLEAGARYAIHGTSSGSFVDAKSATRIADVAKVASAGIAAQYDGILRLGHMDFTDRPSEYFYAVFMANGHHKQLRDLQMLDVLKNGMEVSLLGSLAAEATFTVEHVVIRRQPQAPLASAIQLKSTATHTVFVAPVKFPTTLSPQPTYPSDPFTVDSLNTSVFGVAPVKSVAEYYKEVSYGQQLMTGTTGQQNNGWLLAAQVPAVDAKHNPGCDTDFIQQQGTAAAQAAGYNSAYTTPGFMSPGSTATSNHVVFVFAQTGFNCGWSGLGYIGYGLAFVKQTTSLNVIGHELGHTFGLYHAGSLDCGTVSIGGTCSVTEYGDPFDVMGNISSMHFNAFQKNALKWITDASVSTHVAGTATYTLNPIESPGGSHYAVRIPAGPNRTYWLEYRQPTGFDSGISAANANGVQVRITRPFEFLCGGCDAYSDDTQLLDMSTATTTFNDAVLPTGSRFVDAYYGVAVDVLSQTPTALTIRVTSLARMAQPDLDASATTDLVWKNAATGQTSLSLMDGVTASQTTTVLNDGNWNVLFSGDFNADGKSDLVWRNSSTGQTAVWLMNGVSPTSSAIIFSDPHWAVQFIGDFNGDGRADLVWRNSATGQTAMWLMNGMSATSGAVIFSDPNWSVVQVADFNGDGKSDLLWHNSANGQTAIWLMNGLTATSSAVIFGDPKWTVTLTGDFDGDGSSDLLWRNSATGQTAIWLMNGLHARASAYINANAAMEAKLIGDFDGDGKSDILWKSSDGSTTVWIMNGMTMTASGLLTSDANLSALRTGDFDGDGKSDIVWKNASTSQTSIWLMNGTSADDRRAMSTSAPAGPCK